MDLQKESQLYGAMDGTFLQRIVDSIGHTTCHGGWPAVPAAAATQAWAHDPPGSCLAEIPHHCLRFQQGLPSSWLPSLCSLCKPSQAFKHCLIKWHECDQHEACHFHANQSCLRCVHNSSIDKWMHEWQRFLPSMSSFCCRSWSKHRLMCVAKLGTSLHFDQLKQRRPLINGRNQ